MGWCWPFASLVHLVSSALETGTEHAALCCCTHRCKQPNRRVPSVPAPSCSLPVLFCCFTSNPCPNDTLLACLCCLRCLRIDFPSAVPGVRVWPPAQTQADGPHHPLCARTPSRTLIQPGCPVPHPTLHTCCIIALPFFGYLPQPLPLHCHAPPPRHHPLSVPHGGLPPPGAGVWATPASGGLDPRYRGSALLFLVPRRPPRAGSIPPLAGVWTPDIPISQKGAP